MPRVRLSIRNAGPATGIPFYRADDRSGTTYFIPYMRLIAKLFVLPRDAAERNPPDDLPAEWTPEAILDTGAPLTLFPFPIWQPFRDVIQWHDQPPATVARKVAILGSSFSYRLGRVRIGAFDRHANWFPAVWTNALFLDDSPEAPRQAVLGLRTRLFDQLQIRCANAPEEPLGQVWWLEDTVAAAVSR